jgi:hypothetical protein
MSSSNEASSSRHRGAASRAETHRRHQPPVVVASLEPSSSSSASSSLPYSALSFSPCRQYAALACKDLLQIVQVGPQGVSLLLAVRTAPYFQPAQHNDSATSATSRNNSSSSMTTSVIPSILGGSSNHRREQQDTGRLNLRDFALGQSSSHHAPVTRDTSNVNVVITDVAWSIGKSKSTLRKRRESDDETQHTVGANEGDDDDDNEDDCDYEDDVDLDSAWTMNDAGTAATRKNSQEELQSSFIAAAGSNGMIVVWSAGSLLGLSAPGDASMTSGRRAASSSSSSPSKSSVLVPPEAELSLHTRQVNRLAWHPTHYGWLLSASQDGTVLLWERTKRAPSRSATTTPTTEQQPALTVLASSSDASQKTTPRFRGLFGGFATAVHVSTQCRTTTKATTKVSVALSFHVSAQE